MIMIEGVRKKDGRDYPFSRQGEPHNILEYLLNVHLECNGDVLELTPEKIVVKTSIWGVVDEDVFYGPEEEMAPLVRVASLYIMTNEHHNLIVNDAAKIGAEKKNTRLMALAAPLIIGHSRMKVFMLIGFGVVEKAELEEGIKYPLADLKVLGEYMLETGCSFSESVAQLT